MEKTKKSKKIGSTIGKVLIGLALACMVGGVALPAFAQPGWGPHHRGYHRPPPRHHWGGPPR